MTPKRRKPGILTRLRRWLLDRWRGTTTLYYDKPLDLEDMRASAERCFTVHGAPVKVSVSDGAVCLTLSPPKFLGMPLEKSSEHGWMAGDGRFSLWVGDVGWRDQDAMGQPRGPELVMAKWSVYARGEFVAEGVANDLAAAVLAAERVLVRTTYEGRES